MIPGTLPSTELQTAPVAVALDGMEEAQALALARQLAGTVWGFKVNDLLLREGTAIVPRLKHYGRVFCDAKLHDIPNTVANQVGVLGEAGADLITLHCSAGVAVLKAAQAACPAQCGLLGVTVLTAMPAEDVERVYGRDSDHAVPELARIALEAGLAGIVCSPLELGRLDEIDPAHRLRRVIPGIRPAGWGADDQQRTMAPAEAMAAGADLLVVGRPITRAEDPAEACRRIAEECAAATTG